ncbi:MAG TPA: hypothetical protein VGR14_16850 [Verrucomicrobiae bacterium]|jgi:hypothetical protein|nr:hypothetical protein [Verrucomicrobiae bacterium]
MKPLSIPPLEIPLTEFASQGNALLGIKGSGKTYGATSLAEKLMDAGIPIIAFDPIGVWRNLKVPGKAGKGYPVVVAHPESGDLPLTPRSAPEIVRAAMRQNLSLVLDLYSIKLSKADWRSIVEQSIRILLYENRILRHLFIEEASEFCPQRVQPEQGKVYAEIEKLARMGGNASLGYTLINQRAEEVNKAVLEICDCLILHRQKGKNSLISLGKWLDFSDEDLSKKIVKSLPTLVPGQCWIWPQGQDIPVLCHFLEKNTFHPDRKHPGQHIIAKAVDVGVFVRQLSQSLEKVLAEAKDNDPAALRQRIKELEGTISGQGGQVKTVEVKVPAFTEEERTLLYDLRQEHSASMASLESALQRTKTVIEAIDRAGGAVKKGAVTVHVGQAQNSIQPRPAAQRMPKPDQPAENAGNHSLGRCERAILSALAQYPEGRAINQLAVLTGYANSSGGWNNSLAKLRTLGYIVRGQHTQATPEGLAALGDFEPLPHGAALIEYWLGKLPKCARHLLKCLVDIHPEGLAANILAEAAGYAASSGGFNNALSRLRTLDLITRDRGQPIKANDHLFQ